MANRTIDDFFDELKTNEKAQEKFKAENAETLEDLAKVTGGVASELGYDLSEGDFLAYYNQQKSLLRLRTDSTVDSVKGIKDLLITYEGGDSKSCGARQEAMTKYCKENLRKM